MSIRTLANLNAAVILVLSGRNAAAQLPTEFSRQEPLEIVRMELSGDVARAYAQVSGRADRDENLHGNSLWKTALIADRRKDGLVRIQHIEAVPQVGRPDRLVMLSTSVDESAIKSIVRSVFNGKFTFSLRSAGFSRDW